MNTVTSDPESSYGEFSGPEAELMAHKSAWSFDSQPGGNRLFDGG